MIEIPKHRGTHKLEVEFTYGAEQWAAILATLPQPLAADADLDGERRELEYAASGTLVDIKSHHKIFANGTPVTMWTREHKRVLAQAKADGCVPDAKYLNYVEVGLEMARGLGPRYQGRKRGSRGWLYDMALTTWIRLGGKMSMSRGQYGRAKPSGPVIDFLIAVLRPVLTDDTPGAEALAKIIKKKRRP
jgi:hypothetical protein